MNKKYMLVIGGLLAALLVVGIVGATSAYAQADYGMPFHGRGPGGGEGRGGFGLGDEELAAAAQALGMTTDEVQSALQDGKTLQDLADEAGVDIETVHTAIQAVHAAEMRERIAQAVEDETITQDHADWLYEGLDKGFIGGANGFGFGPGKGHGMGDGPMFQQNQP
jgi:hypothetical protein